MKKVPITMLFLIVWLTASTLPAAYSPQERKDATKTWLKGFEYYEKAEKALQNGQLRQSNTMFKMAVSIFEKVSLKYPKWNTSLISYRIKLCKLKLMKIKDELAKKNIKLTDTDVDKENLELKDKIDELTTQLNKTRKELSTALYSLEAARREAARNVKASNETGSLLREKNQLQKRCALLEADNKRLQQRRVSAVSDETGKRLLDKTLLNINGLKKENERLHTALASERAQFAKLAKEKVRAQYTKKLSDDDNKKLKEQIEILNARIVEIRTASKKGAEKTIDLNDELKKLSAKYARLESELEKTRGKLKKTRVQKNSTAIVKQLENENELLLKDLEIANLNVETALKNKRIADNENEELKAAMKKLKQSLADMSEDRSKTTEALETLSKKLFLTSTVVQKLKTALERKKKEFDALKADSENMAKQYAAAAKKSDSFAKLAEENKTLSAEIEKLRTDTLPIKTKCRKLTAELDSLKEKLFISKTLCDKLRDLLAKERAESAKILKERNELKKKYASTDKKERAFAKLAKHSIEVENANSEFKNELKLAKANIDALKNGSKQRELRLVRLQEELKKLVSENADNIRKTRSSINELTEKCKALTEQLKITRKLNQDLKKINGEGTGKLSMLTEELVNTKLRVEKLRKQLANSKRAVKTAPTPKVAVKEPTTAIVSGKLVSLKRKNNELLSQIQEMRKTINTLKKANKAAAKAATTLSPTEKKRIEKMLDSAALAENEKKKEAAIWYYEKILEDESDNPVALAKLAYAKAEKGDDDEAIKLLNRALVKNPDDLELLQTLAVCYSRMKMYYKALAAAAKANAVNPKNPVTQRYLGIICSHLGWVDAAKRQFGSSFKLDPTSAETAYNAAVLLLTTKDALPEAKLWYDKAVQLGAQPDPKIEELFKNMK